MPYNYISELPTNVREMYSAKAQRAFLSAFNSVMDKTNDEQRAFAAANAAAKVVDGKVQKEGEISLIDEFEKKFIEAEWTKAYINDLPDSSFAYIEPGGEKDEGGKTIPRSLRHFPYKGADGKIDPPHLRNALARAPQSPFGDKAMPKLRTAAKAQGIGEFAKESDLREANFHFQGYFEEGRIEPELRKADVTVIRPGLSSNGFYYSPKVLAGLVSLMENAPAFANHETKSEIKERGTRDIRDIVGWYQDPRQEGDGSIKATLNFSPHADWLVRLIEANPALVGLSINAKGTASSGKTPEGKTAVIAESFTKLYSTDIVTEAGAGGEVVRMIASADIPENEEKEVEDLDIKDLTIDMLKAERPDLINAIEKSFSSGEEDKEEVEKVKEELEEAKKKISDYEEKETEAKINESIAKAEIPEPLRDHFKKMVDPKGDLEEQAKEFKEAIGRLLKPEKKNDPPAASSKDRKRNFLI